MYKGDQNNSISGNTSKHLLTHVIMCLAQYKMTDLGNCVTISCLQATVQADNKVWCYTLIFTVIIKCMSETQNANESTILMPYIGYKVRAISRFPCDFI